MNFSDRFNEEHKKPDDVQEAINEMLAKYSDREADLENASQAISVYCSAMLGIAKNTYNFFKGKLDQQMIYGLIVEMIHKIPGV